MLKDITCIMLDTTIKFTGELMDAAPNLKSDKQDRDRGR